MKNKTLPRNFKVLFNLIGELFEQIKSEIEKQNVSEREFKNIKAYIET